VIVEMVFATTADSMPKHVILPKKRPEFPPTKADETAATRKKGQSKF
jgi:hypothetical protein